MVDQTQLQLELFKWFLTVATGVIAGVLTHWFSRARQDKDLRAKASEKQTDIAISLLASFMSMYEDIAKVLGILFSHPTELSDVEENSVRKIGDWFDFVAALYLNDTADRNLLRKMGFVDQISRFYNLVTQSSVFADAVVGWTHMKTLVTSATTHD